MTNAQLTALKYAVRYGSGRIPLMTLPQTAAALYRRHWIDENDRITVAGRQAFDAECAKVKAAVCR